MAYALLPDPKRRGRYVAVRLRGVTYERHEVISKSGVGEPLGMGLQRVEADILDPKRKQQWNT